jgi:hypothetical protein
MTKVEKVKVVLFVGFITAMITLAVYNSLVHGVQCAFCV